MALYNKYWDIVYCFSSVRTQISLLPLLKIFGYIAFVFYYISFIFHKAKINIYTVRRL